MQLFSHRLVKPPLPHQLLSFLIGPKVCWLRARCRRWRNESPWNLTAPSWSCLEDFKQLKLKKNTLQKPFALWLKLSFVSQIFTDGSNIRGLWCGCYLQRHCCQLRLGMHCVDWGTYRQHKHNPYKHSQGDENKCLKRSKWENENASNRIIHMS